MGQTKRVGGAAQEGNSAVVVAGQDTTNNSNLEEYSAVPAAAVIKMLAKLGDLSHRMGSITSSQVGQVDRNTRRLRSQESLS